MSRYSSSITFVYYNDLEYGKKFFKEVLDLPVVMDQGFALVYQVSESSFVGIVDAKNKDKYTGTTLVSLNTHDVKSEYSRVEKLKVNSLTNIQRLEQIPLDSFFFKDDEGHDFEIQEFLSEKDKIIFKIKK